MHQCYQGLMGGGIARLPSSMNGLAPCFKRTSTHMRCPAAAKWSAVVASGIMLTDATAALHRSSCKQHAIEPAEPSVVLMYLQLAEMNAAFV